jgi:TM2 domain-containing membrane protein YozV
MNDVVNQPNPSQLTDTQQMMLFMSKKKDTGIAYLLLLIGGLIGIHRLYLNNYGISILEILFGSIGSLFSIGILTMTGTPAGFIFLIPSLIFFIIDLFSIPGLVEKYNIKIIKNSNNVLDSSSQSQNLEYMKMKIASFR